MSFFVKELGLFRAKGCFAAALAACFALLGSGCNPSGVSATTEDAYSPGYRNISSIGPATKLVYTTQPSTSVFAGVALATQPSLQVKDAAGNSVTTDYAVTLAMYVDATCTTLDVGGSLSVTSGNTTGGAWTLVGLNYNRTGIVYLGASAAGLTTACSNAITITSATATQLGFSTQPSTPTVAGVNFTTQPVIQVKDNLGNVDPTSSATVALAVYTDNTCSTAAGSGTLSVTSANASSGVVTVAGLNFTATGTFYLKATSVGLTAACSSAFVINPAAANKVVFTTQPSASTTANVNFATQPVITVQDTYGNTVTSSGAAIGLGVYSDNTCATAVGTGTLSVTSGNATSGVWTLAGLKYTQSGTYYLGATSAGLTLGCSSAFAIVAASGSKLTFTTQPSTPTAAGTNFSTQPVITVQDAFNNTVTSSSAAMTLAVYTDNTCATGAGSGTLSVTSGSASSGVLTLSGLNFTLTGTFYLGAASGGLTSACSSAFVINPAAANKIVFTTQASTPTAAGTNFATQPVMTVQDTYGNTVTSSTAAIGLGMYTDNTCATAAGSGTLSVTSGNAVAGVWAPAGVNFTLVGTFYLGATSAGLTKGCSNAEVITVATTSKVAFTTQPSTPTAAGTNFSTQPVVKVQDTYGNTITTSGATINLGVYTDNTCATAAGSGTLSVTSGAATSGVWTLAGLNFNKSGTYYLKASSGALTVDCSTAFVINANTATKVGFTTQPSTPNTAGTNFGTQPVIAVQDTHGNTVTSSSAPITLDMYTDSSCVTPVGSGTLSVTGGSVSSGVWTLAGLNFTKSGSYYLGAASAGLTIGCSSVTVINATTANKLAVATNPSTTNTAGTNFTTQPVFNVQDTYGNLVTGSSAAITLGIFTDNTCATAAPSGTLSVTSGSASSGVWTLAGLNFTKIGTYYLGVSSAGLTSACSASFAVSGASASVLAFATDPSASTAAGTNFATQPVVEVRDAYGNVVTSSSASITLGIYTDNTCATADTGGTLSVTSGSATSGVWTLSGLNYTKTGTKYLKATSGALTAGCSGSFAITAGTATQVVFTTAPSASTNAGTNFATQPVATIQDANGNTVTGSTATVTFSVYTDSSCSTADTGGTLNGTSSGAATAGVFTGVNMNYTKSGTKYMKAASTGLTSACTSASWTINAGSPHHLGVTGPTLTFAGVCSVAMIVTIKDAYENSATYGVNKTVTGTGNSSGTYYSNAACSSASASATIVAGNSTATFYIKDATAENLTLTYTLAGITAVNLSLAIKNIPASIVVGQANMTSNAELEAGGMVTPRHVLVTGTKLFVGDGGTGRTLVWNTIPTANNTAPDYGVGVPNLTMYGTSTAINRTSSSNGLASDGTKLLVADRAASRVLIFTTAVPTASDASANLVLGQSSMTGSSANAGGAVSGQTLNQPAGIATDGTKVVVADRLNNRVLIWNTFPTSNQQVADLVLGQATMTTNTANLGGSASAQTLSDPSGVMINGSTLYVADNGNARVLVWTSWPTANQQAANRVIGQPDMTTTSTGATQSKLGFSTASPPIGIATDGTSLWVSDVNRILGWNTLPATNGALADVVLGQSNMTSQSANSGGISNSSLSSPSGLYVSGTKLIASDHGNNRVLIWNTLPTVNKQGADVIVGQYSSTTKSDRSSLMGNQYVNFPTGVCIDGTKVAIVDQNNNRVLLYNSIPTSNNQAADLVLGQSDMVSNYIRGVSAATLSANGLYGPRGISCSGGKIALADTFNNRVVIWNTWPTANFQAADLELGQTNMTTNTASACTAASLSNPYGVKISGGKLFVADQGNNRVKIWTTWPTSNGQVADLVLGQPDMTTCSTNTGGSVSAQTLSGPYDVSTDGTYFWVSDVANARVLQWNTIPTTNRQAADLVLGQASMSATSCGSNTNYCFRTAAVYGDGTRLLAYDYTNGRLVYFSTYPTTNLPMIDGIIGQSSASTSGAPTTQTAMSATIWTQNTTSSYQNGVTGDGTNLFITMPSENRVLIYSSWPP